MEPLKCFNQRGDLIEFAFWEKNHSMASNKENGFEGQMSERKLVKNLL